MFTQVLRRSKVEPIKLFIPKKMLRNFLSFACVKKRVLTVLLTCSGNSFKGIPLVKALQEGSTNVLDV